MTTTDEPERDFISIRNENVSFGRSLRAQVYNCDSSIILSSFSGVNDDDENNEHSQTNGTDFRPFRWKRQKILDAFQIQPEKRNEDEENIKSSTFCAKENLGFNIDDERVKFPPPRRLPPIPEDKLHRRNPRTVRQEIQVFDDLLPEADLAEVHLKEMPGLQNPEQWKRIAGRKAQNSPPLSRQYYQSMGTMVDLPQAEIPQQLGSYRRPGRSDEETTDAGRTRNLWRLTHRRFFTGSSVVVVLLAVALAIILAFALTRGASPLSTEYYQGEIHVNSRFEASLQVSSSTLSRNYRREFCSLIGNTFADSGTRYAFFYSTCSVLSFRNGSIIARFVLGFTRSLNVTRLNSFLNQTLNNKQVFGGNILNIAFDLANSNFSYDANYTDYDEKDPKDPDESMLMESNDIQETTNPNRTSYTTVTYTTLDKGLSITISETITITNNNNSTNQSIPVNTKSYEVILVPTIDNTKTIVVPTKANQSIDQRKIKPRKSSSHQNLIRSIKSSGDSRLAFIDESTDDRTTSSIDAVSTVDDGKISERSSSASTTSINDGTLTNSNSTLTRTPMENATRPGPTFWTTLSPGDGKTKGGSSEENEKSTTKSSTRLHHRLLERKINRRRVEKGERKPTDRNVEFSMISRSSSVDTLSEKRSRKSSTSKARLTSPFKPISTSEKRFSSFEPQRESLDRVFDVLIAADRKREKHDFWKEKFDQNPSRFRVSSNSNSILNRTQPEKVDLIKTQNFQRNYSPNVFYSNFYNKQENRTTSKPTVPNLPAPRILHSSNGRFSRAPQARQTSDEISTNSEIWTKKALTKRPVSNQRTRFDEQNLIDSKRSSSVEQRKNSAKPTSKNKFFDFFKFHR